MRSANRGLAHNAAVIRTACESGFESGPVELMAEQLYSTLGIEGDDSYEQLFQNLTAEAIDKIGALCMEKNQAFIDFVFLFLNVKASIIKTEVEDQSCKEEGLRIHTVKKICDVLGSGEFVAYIRYPEADWNEAKKDFSRALFLDPLDALDDIDTEYNNVIVINAPDELTGITAVTYAASNIRSRYTDDEWTQLSAFDEDVRSEKFDFSANLPVLNVSDIMNSYTEPEEDPAFLFRNMQIESGGKNGRPYFEASCRCPLCVLIDPDNNNESLYKKLEHIASHSWLIFLVAKRAGPRHNSASQFGMQNYTEEIISELCYQYACDTISLQPPEIGDGYFESLLDDAVRRQGVCIDYSSVTSSKLLRMMYDFRGEINSEVIGHCIANAAKKKIPGSMLTERNFDFLKSGSSIPQNAACKADSIPAIQQFKNQIVGQENAKKQIMDAVSCMNMNRERIKFGLKDNGMHNVFVFAGPPGTAKTTAAQFLGCIMGEEGLLKGDKFISISGARLKAPYVGQTAPLVHEVFANNDIIFIDEVYSLIDSYGNQDSFTQEALGQLCVELEENSVNKLIIMAGYGGKVNSEDNKIKDFLDKNPGIASRINYIIEFKPYDAYTEMPTILTSQAENLGYQIEAKAIGSATAFFADRATCRDFGNGREARRLLEQSIEQQSVRLKAKGGYTKNDLKLLTEADINLAASEIMEGCKIVAGKSKREIGF